MRSGLTADARLGFWFGSQPPQKILNGTRRILKQ